MSAGVLLDTSVALKLVRPEEEYSDLAEALLKDCIRTDRELYIPPLLMVEATNALNRAIRRKNVPLADAVDAITELEQLPLVRVQPPGVYQRTLEFATGHRLASAYDALYVVTALILGVEFWTADQRLVNTLRARAPWVRWIGDYAAPPEGGPGR